MVFPLSPTAETASGFVLAGGQSSRFPPNKALAIFRGTPLLLNALRILAPITSSRYVIGPPALLASCGVRVPVLPDLVESCGPLSGLYTALQHTSSPVNLILACDMPLITPVFFRELLKRVPPAEAAVFRHASGKVEPLAGIYGKKCFPIVEEFFHAGGRKLSELLAELRVAYVQEQDFPGDGFRPGDLANINCPGDLARLEGES